MFALPILADDFGLVYELMKKMEAGWDIADLLT
jgi:hypothetical protein